MTESAVLVELFRTLDDAIFAEQNQAGHRAGSADRVLEFGELWHATCRDADRCRLDFRPVRRPGERCISPYAELVRLIRRPGPMHAVVPVERWHVMQRHRWLDTRPMRAKVQSGRYATCLPQLEGRMPERPVPLTRFQHVVGDDGGQKRGSNHRIRPSEWQVVIVETWTPKVDAGLVAAGLEWLASNFVVPLQLPAEVRKMVAA